MKGLIALLLCSSLTAAAQTGQPRVLDEQYFLQQLTDFSYLPQYPRVSYSGETSTYDRTGGNNDGFGGDYSFVRRNPDSSLVIFEQQGPGVIHRIWTPTPTSDTLDFYIDDSSQPAFSICYLDLFSGKQYPFVAPLCANQLGGYYCYLPIPFNRSCTIVLRGKMTRFHQIGYSLYPAGTPLKSFELKLAATAKAQLASIQSNWTRPVHAIGDVYPGRQWEPRVKKIQLTAGGAATFFQSAQPGTIAGFVLRSAAPLDTVARDLDLRISWDGETRPAVYCPLADFFGYAFGKASMQGLPIGSDGRMFYCYFPMPYDRSAKLDLVYRHPAAGRSGEQVNLEATVYWSPVKRNPATEGRFYASWNRENPTIPGQPFTMLKASGRGHFVGVNLQAQGLHPGITSFFEGDDSTVVDGELRMHGTGSEDFFNGGWYALLDCWDDGMSLPLSGALDYSIPLARTGGYRFFLGDKIGFSKSFLQTIEHGPEQNQVPADYTSVSYYYADRNTPQAAIPTAANTRIYIPDTLEVYPQLTLSAMDETLGIVARWEDAPAKTVHYTVGKETILKFSLDDLPPGDYDLYLDYRQDPVGAAFSLWQRQTQLSDWKDTYAATANKLSMQQLTRIRLSPMNHSLSFRFRTSEGRNQFILGRMVLIRKAPSL